MVRREGVDVGVCVLDMSDEEIDGKITLYFKQASAARAHALELQRFKEWRTSYATKAVM